MIDLGYSNPDLMVAEALAMVRLHGCLVDDESFEMGYRVAFALAINVVKPDRMHHKIEIDRIEAEMAG
ncbi:hypothetical protein J7643_07665 [bacterium]|nr:hypothetical protein [bacterium]